MSKRRLVRLLTSLSTVLVAALLVLLGSAVYLSVLSARLPDLKASPEGFKSAETSIVYAADGSVLAEWYDEQDRKVISKETIPGALKDATVAIEDRRFYEHEGVDPQAIARAFAVNTGAREVRQGGSTITQQTVKLLFTDGRRTLTRKIEEALLALQLETLADKDDVLGVYLNTVYFGRGAYGVESAAERFFGVKASDLTLEQCALLAGCIRSPTRYDPFVNPGAALERRNMVLREMRTQRYISQSRYSAASAEPLGVGTPKTKGSQFAPYFVEYVRRDLLERLGSERLYRGGLHIYTTLEPDAQRAAESAARSTLPAANDPEIALVALRWRDGSVVAIVGGRSFKKEQFDLATQGRRQSGSAFKPFVLAAALEEGYTLESKVSAKPFSTPVKDEVWHVENYENNITTGRFSLREATVWSINTVYARLIMGVGADKVVDVAHRMGITTPIDPDPAIALGGLSRGVSPLEMASAYGTIANSGMSVKPSGVVKVTDRDNRVIYAPDRRGTRAISPKVAESLGVVLGEVYSRGTGRSASFGKPGAVKTGTAQSWRDAWIVGYSGDLSTAVWVGYPKAQVAMLDVRGIPVTGGSYPAAAWKAFMSSGTPRGASADQSQTIGSVTVAPNGQEMYRVCTESLKIARPDCPETMELSLKSGSYSPDRCKLRH